MACDGLPAFPKAGQIISKADFCCTGLAAMPPGIAHAAAGLDFRHRAFKHRLEEASQVGCQHSQQTECAPVTTGQFFV